MAVIFSANRETVLWEWEENGLLPYARIICTQELGSKTECIEKLLTFGYDRRNVLMVGDAPGDYGAAVRNMVRFYPIIVKRESECWKDIAENCLHSIVRGTFTSAQQIALIEAFERSLQVK